MQPWVLYICDIQVRFKTKCIIFFEKKNIFVVVSAAKVPKKTSNKTFFMRETKENLFALPYIKSRRPTLRAKKTMKMKFSFLYFIFKCPEYYKYGKFVMAVYVHFKIRVLVGKEKITPGFNCFFFDLSRFHTVAVRVKIKMHW